MSTAQSNANSDQPVAALLERAAGRQWDVLPRETEVALAAYCPLGAVLSRAAVASTTRQLGQLAVQAGANRVELALALESLVGRYAPTSPELVALVDSASACSWRPPDAALHALELAVRLDGAVQFLAAGARPPATVAVLRIHGCWTEPRPVQRTETAYELPAGQRLTVARYYLPGDLARVPAALDISLLVPACALATQCEPTSVVLQAICLQAGDALVDCAPLEAEWNAAVWPRLQRLLAAIEAARAALEHAQPVQPRTGWHCVACAGYWRCPAWLREAGALGAAPVDPTAWEPGDDAVLGVRLVQLETLVARLREVAKARVRQTGRPLPLGSGRWWGPRATVVKLYDALEFLRAVEQLVGGTIRTSRPTLLEEEVAELAEEIATCQARNVNQLRQELERALMLRGAARREQLVEWSAYTERQDERKEE